MDVLIIFLSGIFYTSFLTAPFSVLMLASVDFNLNPYILSAIAGSGAVLGDLFIVKIFRTLFSAFSFVRHEKSFVKLKKTLARYHLDFISIVLGSLIVASPLPDELGLILLGASKLSYFKLAILTFLLNGAGILLIVQTMRNLR